MTEKNSLVKEKILDSAITIFSQNGFDCSRTRDIATLADVNISTLHYHFKSKGNIYGSVIKKIHEQSNKFMMPTMIAQREIIETSKDKREILEAIKTMSLTFVETITSPQNKRYSKIISFEQIEQSKHFESLFK